MGCNSRLDSIQAAVLRIKLRRLDEYCDARRAAADYYDAAFAGNEQIVTPYRAPYSKHVFHQYTLQLKGVDRDAVVKALGDRNIPAMIYYPVPSHKQNMLRAFAGEDCRLPVTDMLNECVISLPMHTELSEEELRYISTGLLEVLAQATVAA